MPAPTSAVEICNFALDHLKQKQITAITGDNLPTAAVICARHYDQTRRAVLESHPWNFAVTRKQLTPDATAPLFGYSNAYNLPPDFIRLLTIGDDATGLITPTELYQIEGGQLLTGAEFTVDSSGTQNVRYIFDQTNVNKFSPLFIEILALEMALNMAYAFTGLGGRVSQIEKLLEKKAPRGYAIDGQQRPPTRVQRSKFRRARRSNRGTVAGPNTVLP
jgi:hypothetical protein